MDYLRLVEQLRSAASPQCSVTEYGSITENGRTYPLIRVATPGERRLVITAGFHGEEPAGPLTLAEHLPQILSYAASKNVGLTIYPCVNPSGFEAGTRYNASGEKPNNDFLRYETAPGLWKGELEHDEPFLRFALYDGGPKETRALRAELEAQPTPLAALDIHQERCLQGAWTYAYVFGDRAPYRLLMRKAEVLATVARNHAVDEVYLTDNDGLIELRDGSVTDYFERRGARFTATLETTTQTPLPRCHEINLVWVMGFVDLAAI